MPIANPPEEESLKIENSIHRHMASFIASVALQRGGRRDSRGDLVTPSSQAADALIQTIAGCEEVVSRFPMAEIYQRALEEHDRIYDGHHKDGFDLTNVAPCRAPEPKLVADSDRGRGVPRWVGGVLSDLGAGRALGYYSPESTGSVSGVTPEQIAELVAGEPEEDEDGFDDYNDTYNDVIGGAILHYPDGDYFLDVTENGDVFAVPVGMEHSEPGDGHPTYWFWPDGADPAALSPCRFGEALAMMAMFMPDDIAISEDAVAKSWFVGAEMIALRMVKVAPIFRIDMVRDGAAWNMRWEGNSDGLDRAMTSGMPGRMR